MKDFVRRARDLTDSVTGAIRRALDPPLGSDARPIDVRRAIVEAIEQRIEPVGGGRRVLPGDTVAVKVLVEAGSAQAALQAVLTDIQEGLAQRLHELRCDVPPQFVVEVSYVRKRPADWAPAQRFTATLTRREKAAAARPAELPELTITVLKGVATCATYRFAGPVIRVGRTEAPADERGRPRFNDVIFEENDTLENRSVGRGHATIRFRAAAGEYRLFDDGSSNGTRVIRAGDVIDVQKRDPLGVVLLSGDEVQFGRASVRVQIGAS